MTTQRIKKRRRNGLFLTLEGGEGSGKSTQIALLADWLQKRGYPVLLTHEPGGTVLADEVRKILLNPKNKGMDFRVELLLYEVARKDHVREVIEPALREGKVVLCDRFTDATLAYQGYARGLPLKIIEAWNTLATGGIFPDRTYLLDLPVSDGLARVLQRSKGRKKALDRLDLEKKRFHQKVRNGYLTLAKKDKMRRFKILDAKRSKKEVFEEICRDVVCQLAKSF